MIKDVLVQQPQIPIPQPQSNQKEKDTPVTYQQSNHSPPFPPIDPIEIDIPFFVLSNAVDNVEEKSEEENRIESETKYSPKKHSPLYNVDSRKRKGFGLLDEEVEGCKKLLMLSQED